MKTYIKIIKEETLNLLRDFCCLLGFHNYLITKTPIEGTQYNDVTLTCTNCKNKKQYLENN